MVVTPGRRRRRHAPVRRTRAGHHRVAAAEGDHPRGPRRARRPGVAARGGREDRALRPAAGAKTGRWCPLMAAAKIPVMHDRDSSLAPW